MSKEKRKLGDYEIIQSIYIGDKEVVFGVDKKDPYPFMVCYCDYHNPLSAAWPTEGVASDDYLEAMQIFVDRVQSQIDRTKAELAKFPLTRPCLQRSIVSPMTVCVTLWARSSLSIPSRNAMSISIPPISLCWLTEETELSAAEVGRCSALALPQANKPDGKGTMCLEKSSPNVCPIGQRKRLLKSRRRKKRKNRKVGRNADMEIRALTPAEQKYTYAQSMQLEGQTANIGHLRGDFDSSGYGFYTTWTDTRTQWKTDEFKAEFDEVINALRSDKYGLLKSRSAMSAYARQYADSAFKGCYCTEYGFRVDTEKHAYLLRCNPTRGDYNFYCYCFVKEWLDKHIQKAEQGIRFIDPNYKELFRIPDGGRIIVTNSWGEKREYSCRFIDECHTEVGNNIFHICEFAERMQQNGATYEPKQAEQPPQKAPRKNDYER